jgi:hypothetical protein
MTKSFLLCSILFLGACTASDLSSTSQKITCATDPGTGVILSCQPGDGGGSNTCTDIDEDGDGEPHDEVADDSGHHSSFDGSDDGSDDQSGDADDDGDGIDNHDDCDGHPGEDHGGGSIDLPYDVRPGLGATTTPIADAFAEKGAQPTAILSVTGATWRLAELQAGTAFAVTDADCSHAGNRDVGRDRVVVRWSNADGSVQADHLDIRYCK